MPTSVPRGNEPIAASPPASPASLWHWSTWPLTRKLPVLTGTIVVCVVSASLLLTYNALTASRLEVMHDRLRQLTEQIVQSRVQSTRTRAAVYRHVASDPSVLAALRAAAANPALADSSPVIRTAADRLLQLRTQPDSSLPIELWTADGQRVLHVGTDVRDDTLPALRPELRTLSGRPISEVPSGKEGFDSTRYGAFYSSNGKVLFWTVVPVFDGARRVGYLAQQRRYGATPQSEQLIRQLIGNDVSLYLHNTTDTFWSNFIGTPVPPLKNVDPTHGDFLGERKGIGDVTMYDRPIPGTPWALTLEAPVKTVLSEPRRIVRRLMLISLIIAIAGVLASWAASRRITRPIATLAAVSEAIARGDYGTRVTEVSHESTNDEISRLAISFNRMASEIEASHHALEEQVEEARAVSSELEQTNEQLQDLSADAEESRDAAQEANRAKSDFLAVMSHELRTPLNAIGGYTEILKLGIYGAVSERQQEALNRITRSQQMLLTLINDILNFAKLDAGQVHYRMTNVSLHEALTPLESLVAPQLEARSQIYNYHECTTPLLVRADRDKLQQIILNLLTNAIKFTPDGGTITLSCHPDGEFAIVEVADTGVGIGGDRIEAVFDPFVQVDRALNRPHEGVGLGLSISRDLAQGMGGTLTARSTLGEGSVFTLKLRRSPAALPA